MDIKGAHYLSSLHNAGGPKVTTRMIGGGRQTARFRTIRLLGNAAVDGTMVNDTIEDDATVEVTATQRRRWFLWQHIQGGEAEA